LYLTGKRKGYRLEGEVIYGNFFKRINSSEFVAASKRDGFKGTPL
jgi:hypothetical protein